MTKIFTLKIFHFLLIFLINYLFGFVVKNDFDEGDEEPYITWWSEDPGSDGYEFGERVVDHWYTDKVKEVADIQMAAKFLGKIYKL